MANNKRKAIKWRSLEKDIYPSTHRIDLQPQETNGEQEARVVACLPAADEDEPRMERNNQKKPRSQPAGVQDRNGARDSSVVARLLAADEDDPMIERANNQNEPRRHPAGVVRSIISPEEVHLLEHFKSAGNSKEASQQDDDDVRLQDVAEAIYGKDLFSNRKPVGTLTKLLFSIDNTIFQNDVNNALLLEELHLPSGAGATDDHTPADTCRSANPQEKQARAPGKRSARKPAYLKDYGI